MQLASTAKKIKFWVGGFLCFFQCALGHEDQHQIKRNFRNILIIYMVMTSTQNINKIIILHFFDQHWMGGGGGRWVLD